MGARRSARELAEQSAALEGVLGDFGVRGETSTRGLDRW